jgi:serine/threonine protein kinase
MEVIEYFKIKGNECVVYKYYDVDLLKLMKTKNFNINTEADARIIRGILKQVLEGVKYLHDQGIIHRDLKPENIMLDKNGIIKLIDFDLARFIDKQKPMSRGVATIYYRPPEIFFGDVNYFFSVDMWAIGCILAEMFLKDPIFKGHNELEVLFKIFEILGSASVKYFFIRKIRNLIGLGAQNFLIICVSQIIYQGSL